MRALTSHLYFWVLLAIVAGGVLGYVDPETGVELKPLGDGFIALIKMLISPIIFCTVVLGIAGAGKMKKVGRVGGKALIYFEVVSTIALLIGLVVANVLLPGAGFNADPATLDANAVADYAKRAPRKPPPTLSCASFRPRSLTRSPARAISSRSCSSPFSSAMR